MGLISNHAFFNNNGCKGSTVAHLLLIAIVCISYIRINMYRVNRNRQSNFIITKEIVHHWHWWKFPTFDMYVFPLKAFPPGQCVRKEC